MKYSDEHIQNQIESYLNQEMTDLERSRFEKQIHDNPELHEEVQMQEAAIEAIRKERKLLLKAGLNQVPVSLWSTGLMEVAKVAAITVGLGIASVTGYYLLNSNNPTSGEKSVVSVPQVEEKRVEEKEDLKIPESSESKTVFSSIPENSEVAEPKSFAKPRREVQSGKGSVAHAIIEKGNDAPYSEEQTLNEPVEPTSNRGVHALTGKDLPNPVDGISNRTSLESIHPEVVFKRDNKNIFHYQFADGKLILYADFTNKLYEVIELNQNGTKQVFFCYENTFYPLNTSQFEIVPLKEVQDKNLVQILRAYQKRRN